MNKISLMLIAGMSAIATSTFAGQINNWATGDTATEACDKLKKDLWSDAEYRCRSKGGVKEALSGSCDTQKTSAGYRARGKIVYSCNGE